MDKQSKAHRSRPPRSCFYCNETGHIKANCPKKKQDYLNSLKCYKCGETGHLQRNCPQLHLVSSSQSQETGERRKQGKSLEDSFHTSVLVSDSSQATSSTRTSGASIGATPTLTSEPSASKSRYPAFIDTHCHLEYVFSRFHHHGNFQAFKKSFKYPENFEGCISTFCDTAAFSSFGIWEDLLKESNVWGTFGIHPHNAKYYYSSGPDLEDKILKCVEHPKCVAYGEIGLDYAEHSPSDQQTQREVLIRQLQVALPFSKPLLFHCRGADDELLHIISEHVPREWRIHLHCYTGSESTALRFMEKFPNLYFGVCGNVTYRKNHNLRQTVTNLPIHRLVVETDAPYNTPSNMPSASCFSHPAHAFYVAKEIALLKKADLSEVLSTVRDNTKKLYGI